MDAMNKTTRQVEDLGDPAEGRADEVGVEDLGDLEDLEDPAKGGAAPGGAAEGVAAAGRATPLRIRAHTLLCLQGFRGGGYSPSFVKAMTAVHSTLQEQAETPVKVIDSPDILCSSCPNLGSSGCALLGEKSEEEVARQDRLVLGILHLNPGETLSWKEIQSRIRKYANPDALPEICGSCQWLSRGYCREGIARLRVAP